MKFNYLAFIILCFTLSVVHSRKHQLVLENDIRKYFSITTFGFFDEGQLEVHLNYLTFPAQFEGIFGFTLTKTVSDSITPYMESHQNKCLLIDDSIVEDGNVEIVSFLLDLKHDELAVNCSKLISSLEILPVVDSNSSTVNVDEGIQKLRVKKHFNSDVRPLIKQKRSAEETKSNPTDSPEAVSKVTESPITKVTEEVVTKEISSDLSVESVQSVTSESKSCTSLKIPFKNKVTEQRRQIYDLRFVVLMRGPNSAGLYSLYFHNCAGYKELPIPVNLSISITEKNGENYLSAGEIKLPDLYFLMSFLFFVTGCIWISVLRRKKEETFKIHYLMGVLVFLKSLSLLFHGINFHIIAKDGYPMEAWAVLYYITHLLKGALLFITIVLIGTGWAFIKHILSDKDKKIFMIVIPLQVLANVAKIIMEESEEGDSQHTTWREVFILVDLMCCGAILFPVVWSIRHLQEASHTDGKAAINLEKLKLFRHFYIMIVCYIYFTRIIVYLLKITVPFQYEWLDELFRESATLTFFVFTGYNFRPTTSNPYFRLSQDDDLELDEVITQTGFTEAATKTVRAREMNSHDDENGPTRRESSHEYD